MESHFEYQPLQTGEIRLVRLKLAPNAKDFPLGGGPSRESELLYAPIECEIANYSLGNCPPFIALSYTWNTDEDQREIKLNGHPWIVRRNLARFLRHARDDLELYNSPSILSRVGKALKGLNKLLANGVRSQCVSLFYPCQLTLSRLMFDGPSRRLFRVLPKTNSLPLATCG
jgi:hypothetical protein